MGALLFVSAYVVNSALNSSSLLLAAVLKPLVMGTAWDIGCQWTGWKEHSGRPFALPTNFEMQLGIT